MNKTQKIIRESSVKPSQDTPNSWIPREKGESYGKYVKKPIDYEIKSND